MFYQPVINFTATIDMQIVLAQDGTFSPNIIFSDPFRLKSDPHIVFIAGRLTTSVYRVDLTNHHLLNTFTMPLDVPPFYNFAMNRDTHSTNIFGCVQTVDTTMSINKVAVQVNFMTNAIVSVISSGQLTALIPVLSSYPTVQVKLFAIDTVRVVWILFEVPSTISILSKWNADFTLINYANVSATIPSASFSGSGFSYDFHWILWNTNNSYPIKSYTLGGLDYVPEYLPNILNTNIDHHSFRNNATTSQIVAFTTTPFGYTIVLEPQGPVSPTSAPGNQVSGYQLNIYDNNFLSVKVVPFLVTRNTLTGYSQLNDVPYSITASSFGDVFIFLQPSQTILRLACQR